MRLEFLGPYLRDGHDSVHISCVPFFWLHHLCGGIIVWNVEPQPCKFMTINIAYVKEFPSVLDLMYMSLLAEKVSEPSFMTFILLQWRDTPCETAVGTPSLIEKG